MLQTLEKLTINGDRLIASIAQLGAIGQLPNGGVCRIAFSEADLAARNQIQTWMIAAGMTTRIDAAGNLIGTYAGKSPDAPVLATGSHIDTVPVGGRYDGCLGVLSGLEVVRVLQEQNLRLNHSLEVIVFTDEESSVIGSKAMAGEVIDNPDYYQRRDGTSIQECLARVGGDWSQIATARRSRSQMAAFVELHVEQGSVLEYESCQIGVVQGVVGQYRLAVKVVGRPNHAGTTPMHLRKDALVAAAQVVLAVNRIGLETVGDQVATVGSLKVSPNATNTIPGEVNLTIDLRDLSQPHLESLIEQMHQEFAAIAEQTGTVITLQELLHILPTPAAPTIMQTIRQICDQLGYSWMELPSRAGHDGQEIGRFTDMGMIFVPSEKGISHSEEEFTTDADCVRGATVLLQTLLQLDRDYPG